MDQDDTTLDALGTARIVLYGVQFEKGPLASRVADTVGQMTRRGQVGPQPPEAIVGNLRNAAAFDGSLRKQIGFIDRPEDEIRSFLTAVATGIELQSKAAFTNSSAPTPFSSSGQAGTV